MIYQNGVSNQYYSTDVKETQPKKKYSETTKKVVFGIARMLGYYSTSSTAIRASRDLYNVCAQQVEENKKFYHQGLDTTSVYMQCVQTSQTQIDRVSI